jgi:hypothetical protein
MANDKNTPGAVGIAIKRIKDIVFMINEAPFIGAVQKEVKIEFQQFTAMSIKDSTITLTLRVYYYSPEAPENILLDLHTQNVFLVSDLESHVVDEKIVFPEEVWITIVSLSISHSRAILAQRTAGTVYQDTLIPLVNPREIAQVFFFPDAEKPV